MWGPVSEISHVSASGSKRSLKNSEWLTLATFVSWGPIYIFEATYNEKLWQCFKVYSKGKSTLKRPGICEVGR